MTDEGNGGLRFVERSKGVSRVWCNMVEEMIKGENLREFCKTLTVGSRAYVAWSCANGHGRYLAVVEYGGGRRAFSRILEGREGRGWQNCAVEMRKVVDYIESHFVVGSRSSKSHGGSKSNGACGNMPMPENKILMVDRGRRLYVEALVGKGHYQEIESLAGVE
jgi:hypothetical protein